jgi:hypothetical protein
MTILIRERLKCMNMTTKGNMDPTTMTMLIIKKKDTLIRIGPKILSYSDSQWIRMDNRLHSRDFWHSP